MKQVLVAAIRISGSYLAKKIAEDNPHTVVHLVGPRIKGMVPKNFSWIGEEVREADIIKKIIQIHKSYDFIYANELTLQANSEFQSWKTKFLMESSPRNRSDRKKLSFWLQWTFSVHQ